MVDKGNQLSSCGLQRPPNRPGAVARRQIQHFRCGCGWCAADLHGVAKALCQAAQDAVKNNGSHLQSLFRRLLPRLGYVKAIWAVAHRLSRIVWKILHQGATFVEYGQLGTPEVQKRRARKLVPALKRLGYTVQISRTPPAPAAG